MTRRLAVLLAVTGALAVASGVARAQAPSPPGPPPAGPGSEDHAITSAALAARGTAGVRLDGSKVWWWVPATLRDGDRAPVVVVLHGFGAPFPALYGRLIDHVVRQGIIVIFPAYQLGLLRLGEDTDQNAMLARAERAVDRALDALGPRAERGRVTIVGHSLGGLLAAAWNPSGGARARSLVLDHPSLAGTPYAAPGAFAPPVAVTPIDIAALAPRVRVPVQILTGDSDRIAPPSEALSLAGLLERAPVTVWEARTDTHGRPPLVAWHLAPLAGAVTTNALDWRFSWAALDLAIQGRTAPGFDLGTWSDGVPVLAPVELAP